MNASKTKTMIVTKTCTMNPHSPTLTIGRTVLKETDDLVVFGVTFDSKMTFQKHLCLVSRAASQRLDILRMSWQVYHDDCFLGDAFRVLSCPLWSIVLQCGARLLIHTPWWCQWWHSSLWSMQVMLETWV